MNLIKRFLNRHNNSWWRGYSAGQADGAAVKGETADYYRAELNRVHEKIGALAKEHSEFRMGGSHPVDTRPGESFFCNKCRIQWPCPTFIWATGRDFAPLKLTLKEK